MHLKFRRIRKFRNELKFNKNIRIQVKFIHVWILENVWLNSEMQILTFLISDKFLLNLSTSLNVSKFLNLKSNNFKYSFLLWYLNSCGRMLLHKKIPVRQEYCHVTHVVRDLKFNLNIGSISWMPIQKLNRRTFNWLSKTDEHSSTWL